MQVGRLCVLLFMVLSCKPIVRQESASQVQIAVAVRAFKRLMQDGNNFKDARHFLTTSLNKKETILTREVVGSYLAEGNHARFGDLLRSYTHSAPAVALNNKLDQFIARIAVSKNEQEVAGLLTQVEEQIGHVQLLYSQRNRVFLATTGHGDDSYSLLLAMRDDFSSWRRALQQDLDKSLRKYAKQTGEFWPENFRERIIDLRQQLEFFNTRLGIRSDYGAL